jgi:hypothetical protein
MFERHGGLSPDNERAMCFLEQTLINGFQTVLEIPPLQAMCLSGNSFVVSFLLRTRNLPRGASWVWNQSRNRISSQRVDGNPGSLLFYKLGTRRGFGVQETPPNYKIWVFNYFDPSTGHLSMVWCERGEPLSATEDVPSLADYSFLAPFTTEALAREFGWL